MWVYRSPVGTFWIRQNQSGHFTLGIGDEALGNYSSAIAAADDVFTKSTGHYDWDRLQSPDGPTDIHEWERG